VACTLSLLVDSSGDKRYGCGYIKTGIVTTINRWVNVLWNIGQYNIKLVGTPVMKFDQLIATLQCCYQQPPSDLANLKQVVQDVLPAEACAIEFI
jgi:hypothetical protein